MAVLWPLVFFAVKVYVNFFFFRSAFETWKHAVKENREERQNKNVADAFQNEMLLSKVSHR